MNVKDKIGRIVARNPELKETIESLSSEKTKALFHKIVEKGTKKIIIVGKDSERIARLYVLSHIINRGYIHITNITTAEILDAYIGDEEEGSSLTSVVDQLVVIKDSRAYVPNKQKSNMIMQVFEQNDSVIYYYKGSNTSYIDEHRALSEYAEDNNIQVITLKNKKPQGDTV